MKKQYRGNQKQNENKSSHNFLYKQNKIIMKTPLRPYGILPQGNRMPILLNLVGQIEKKKILDYGGHNGNLIYFSNGLIDEKDYTVIDVNLDAIESGKINYPNATWIFNDVFNYVHNHNGKQLTFPILKKQDYIFSFSVFTHIDLYELVQTLKWMISLKPEKIMISFIDITNDYMLNWFYKKRLKDYGTCVDFRDLKNNLDINICYILNNDKIIINEHKHEPIDYDLFLTIYRSDFILEHFNDHDIRCKIEKSKYSNHNFIIWESNE